MIVAFEGLPCAYKTATVDRLQVDLPDAQKIGEFILNKNIAVSPETCIVNDIAKSGLSRLFEKDFDVVLMDRSFLSTIVYEATASEERGEAIIDRYRQLIDLRVLANPDHIIYFDISPLTCIKRAVEIGRFNPNYVWFEKPQDARANYLHYLGGVANSSVHYISTENIDIDEAVAQSYEIIGEIN